MEAGPLRHLPWIIPTALLALTVLAGSAGLYILYQHDRQVARERDARALEVRQLQRDVHSQSGDIQSLRSRVSALETQNSSLQDKAAHPHVVIWNVAQRVSGSADYLAGGVPDTFTYHLKLSSNAPISVGILSFAEFANATDCVRRGLGSTHDCMQRAPGQHWKEITTLDVDFHDAEGCAAYVSIITAAAPATVTPDVSVTYNPAPRATGTCAG
jgi:hypothetical protein